MPNYISGDSPEQYKRKHKKQLEVKTKRKRSGGQPRLKKGRTHEPEHTGNPANLVHKGNPANLVHKGNPANLVHKGNPANLVHKGNPANLRPHPENLVHKGRPKGYRIKDDIDKAITRELARIRRYINNKETDTSKPYRLFYNDLYDRILNERENFDREEYLNYLKLYDYKAINDEAIATLPDGNEVPYDKIKEFLPFSVYVPEEAQTTSDDEELNNTIVDEALYNMGIDILSNFYDNIKEFIESNVSDIYNRNILMIKIKNVLDELINSQGYEKVGLLFEQYGEFLNEHLLSIKYSSKQEEVETAFVDILSILNTGVIDDELYDEYYNEYLKILSDEGTAL